MADYESLIAAFKLTWDNFPSVASLVDKNSVVIAVNKFAEAMGAKTGVICAKLPPLERHKGCLRSKTLETHEAHLDRPDKNIRGWLPIDGYPDVVVHFSLPVPEVNK